MHREEIYPFAPSKKNQFLLFIHNPPEREFCLKSTLVTQYLYWQKNQSTIYHSNCSDSKRLCMDAYRQQCLEVSTNCTKKFVQYVSCFAEGSVDGLIRKCKFNNCSNANVKRARIVFVTEQFCRPVGRQSDKNCFSLLFAIVHHPIKNAQVA